MFLLKNSWDSFSDQPHRLPKKEKRKEVFRNLIPTLKTQLIALGTLPIAFLKKTKREEISVSDFFGIGVNLDKYSPLIHELPIQNLAIRFPLWEMERIEEYVEFVKSFEEKRVLLIVIQDKRENLEEDFRNIFSSFPISEFQIGNAINRKKWGFFSVDEYLDFYKTARKVRDSEFPNLKLVGSSVIDFEYNFTAHTLFEKYDAISSLLYVDRRGNPENKQMGFDLLKKIDFLSSLVSLFGAKPIYITETNWPIENTEPYTPTSQLEAVSLEEYKIYMVRYFLIALASGKVKRVYWHQLVSRGYGLIEEISGEKYPAFDTFKFLLETLQNQNYISHNFSEKDFEVHFSEVSIFWSLESRTLEFSEEKEVSDLEGNRSFQKVVEISGKPIFVR
jgi:hypothetical protein